VRLVSRAENRRDLMRKQATGIAPGQRVVGRRQNGVPKSDYDRWTVGGTREERAAQPEAGFTVMPLHHVPGAFRCFKCRADVTGAALFCDAHLAIEARP